MDSWNSTIFKTCKHVSKSHTLGHCVYVYTYTYIYIYIIYIYVLFIARFVFASEVFIFHMSSPRPPQASRHLSRLAPLRPWRRRRRVRPVLRGAGGHAGGSGVGARLLASVVPWAWTTRELNGLMADRMIICHFRKFIDV